MPAARLDPAALDAKRMDAIAEQRSDEPFQLGTATMQMLGIHHDQDIRFSVCRGAQQVGHARAQRKRLFFGSCLSVQLLYARPT